MKQRNQVIQKFGWWVRLYIGGTSNRRRIFRWRFEGIRGLNYGITFRLHGENCLGIQWRKSYVTPTQVEKCPGCDLYLPTDDERLQQMHMTVNHPEIIKKRMESSGFVHINGRWVDMWSSE